MEDVGLKRKWNTGDVTGRVVSVATVCPVQPLRILKATKDVSEESSLIDILRGEKSGPEEPLDWDEEKLSYMCVCMQKKCLYSKFSIKIEILFQKYR